VDPIVRVGSISRVVGEIGNSIAGTRPYSRIKFRALYGDGHPFSCTQHATPVVIGAFLRTINDVRDRIDKHLVKHDILRQFRSQQHSMQGLGKHIIGMAVDG